MVKAEAPAEYNNERPNLGTDPEMISNRGKHGVEARGGTTYDYFRWCILGGDRAATEPLRLASVGVDETVGHFRTKGTVCAQESRCRCRCTYTCRNVNIIDIRNPNCTHCPRGRLTRGAHFSLFPFSVPILANIKEMLFANPVCIIRGTEKEKEH